jgi:hypothetical protein
MLTRNAGYFLQTVGRMLSAYEVLIATLSVLVAFLLLSDVRDEFLRKLKPLILRALENAGVLTQDEYLRRSGIDAAQLLAIKQATTAASQFAKQVVQQHQQPQSLSLQPVPASASPSSSVSSMSSPVYGTPTVQPSPIAVITSPATSITAAAAPASTTQKRQSVIAAAAGVQAQMSPVQIVGVASPSSSKGTDQATALAAALHEDAQVRSDSTDSKPPEISRSPSRSRSHKQKSESRESKDSHAAAPELPSVVNAPTSPLPGGQQQITLPPNSPMPSAALALQQQQQQQLLAQQQLAAQHHSDQQHDNHPPDYLAPVPVIGGYPISSLKVVHSRDGEISVEEYYNEHGQKVAWRRGTIWDSDFIYTLSKDGVEMVKYGSWGSPHVRRIKFLLDPKSKQLCIDWGTGSILLDDVLEVRAGKKLFPKRYLNDPLVLDDACFSIVTQKRNLDLSFHTSHMKEKRDMSVFGIGEVTGTRKSGAGAGATGGSAQDGPPSTTSQPSSNIRRNSFTPSVESRNSSTRGSAGASGASLGLVSMPIPYKKVIDAINIQTGTLPTVAMSGLMMGGSQQREEYSLSTRQSYLQQPGTPSQNASAYYRSQQSSPAAVNYSANRQQAQIASRPQPMQQLQMHQRLQMYASAPATGTPSHQEGTYSSLPPPHFPTSARHQAGAAGQSRSATPADYQTQQQLHQQQLQQHHQQQQQQFDISQQSAYDAEQLLRNSMMMGAAHQQQQQPLAAHSASSAHYPVSYSAAHAHDRS